MSHLFDFFKNRHLEVIRHVCARKRENEKPILLAMDISRSGTFVHFFILSTGYSQNIFPIYLHAFRKSFSQGIHSIFHFEISSEFHGKLIKGMITWAIRENIRNPMPDYSSSPLETLNNIWDINPNDQGSTDVGRPQLSTGVHQGLRPALEPEFRARRSEIIQS